MPRSPAQDEPCPCASGRAFSACCGQKGIDWRVGDDGVAYREGPLPSDLAALLRRLRAAARAQEGLPPGPLFPDLRHGEVLEHEVVRACQEAGLDPAWIYAFQKTGLMMTEESEAHVPDVDIAAWYAALDEYERRRAAGEEDPVP